jgi:hypothetical protein
MRNGDINNKM